jgi:hypothetical protein
MHFGSPEFVLALVAMALFAGVLKTAIRARHGAADGHSRGGKKARNAEVARLQDENAQLRTENTRLNGRLETYEDRLIVLERIVTDRGYGVAAEIEALRDERRPSGRLAAPQSEERN